MKSMPRALLEGYASFKYGRLRTERARYHELAAKGQKPDTMIIGCCDSRAAPETIFDAIPGELFVVRNVANLVPPFEPDGEYHSTSAALEFAVQALKVKNIVVLGHARCGGIAASLQDAPEPLSPGDFIGKWISLTENARKDLDTRGVPDDKRIETMEMLSIKHSIENLRSFPCISIQEERGKIELHGAYFDIESGALSWLDREIGWFRPVEIDLQLMG
ncbi:MAG: carbonic anhydrase [Rhodobiaceae bacterium]|nr:carbonic anhydrase [Rhodobiaceae bacterium]MCC0012459.1 carbonic anhydrase [Rhodobiaceae bacterium]MCC0052002.1 carbonic anhydrase [Rhodobiaceae bacterium]MCC0061666.1 carbonic anhydrase [Rhodobiaceae bacterium]